jgi:hypothetical protein
LNPARCQRTTRGSKLASIPARAAAESPRTICQVQQTVVVDAAVSKRRVAAAAPGFPRASNDENGQIEGAERTKASASAACASCNRGTRASLWASMNCRRNVHRNFGL